MCRKKLLMILVGVTLACGQSTFQGPTSTLQTEKTSGSDGSTPTPLATPIASNGWTVQCAPLGTMTVTYSGEASRARVLTFYTSFDGPAQYAEQWNELAVGDSVTRIVPVCHQGDAEPESGHPAGHCYFDKDGNPANEWVATASCKPTPKPTPTPTPAPTPTPTPKCKVPETGTEITWKGKGDPETECQAFGNYVFIGKDEEKPWVIEDSYDFLICKAGNDRIVQPVNKYDEDCLNGKEISHVTACVCDDRN